MRHYPLSRTAFSLVELSIVLVILGLLVGGILAGQSLIRASELRALGGEYQRYATAVHAFRDKYFALPGDMGNATSFWGKDNAQCGTHTGTVANPGTCNGNADGIYQYSLVPSGWGEAYRAWQHLALAGLIEGSFTGNAGPDNTGDVQIGSNAPRSKIDGAGWMLSYRDNSGLFSATNNRNFALNYRNWMQSGAKRSATASYIEKPFLRSEEAWNIDKKMDDGIPASGRIHAGGTIITACTSASSETDYTGSYKLADGSPELCYLLWSYQ